MRSAVSKSLFVTILTAAAASTVFAEPNPGGAFPWEGEVSASNVFVRSGAGSNWYPTSKLNSGDRVLVLGEKFGWYQIAPPQGSFSYVDMSVVDRRPGAKTGTIKQDKVYVRAGSALESRKSSTQVVLNKGATVTIQGEAEGFFKIAPPSGATLYISKQYVKPVTANLSTGLVERHVAGNPQPAPVATTPTTEKPFEPAKSEETKVAVGETAMPVEPSAKVSPAGESASLVDASQAQPVKTPEASSFTTPQTAAETSDVEDGPILDAKDAAEKADADAAKSMKPEIPGTRKSAEKPAEKVAPAAGRYQAMLTVLESELTSLSQKPFDQQDVVTLQKRYEEIAAQSDEDVPAQIAKIRARQLRDRANIRDSRKGLRTDEIELANYRASMDSERMKIMRRRTDAAMVKFDLEGELRKSAVFTADNRRFRLVDHERNETIAYVDIPRSVEPNVDQLIGRLVGIRSAGQTFSPSARLPIVVAASVTDLTPRSHIGDDGAVQQSSKPDAPSVKPKDESASTDAKKPEPKKSVKAGDNDELEPDN